jgi:hypothetical protein
MTQPPQPTERFAQQPRLAELITALGFRRYRLFLTGLLYQEPDGPPRRAAGPGVAAALTRSARAAAPPGLALSG